MKKLIEKIKTKTVSFLKIAYAKDRLFIILPSVLILIIIIISLVNSIREIKEQTEHDPSIKNVESNLIITPTEEVSNEQTDFNNIVYYPNFLEK